VKGPVEPVYPYRAEVRRPGRHPIHHDVEGGAAGARSVLSSGADSHAAPSLQRRRTPDSTDIAVALRALLGENRLSGRDRRAGDGSDAWSAQPRRGAELRRHTLEPTVAADGGSRMAYAKCLACTAYVSREGDAAQQLHDLCPGCGGPLAPPESSRRSPLARPRRRTVLRSAGVETDAIAADRQRDTVGSGPVREAGEQAGERLAGKVAETALTTRLLVEHVDRELAGGLVVREADGRFGEQPAQLGVSSSLPAEVHWCALPGRHRRD